MYFSCHTWAFHDLTLVEALGTIGRLGFRYADIGTGAGFPTNRAVAQPKRAAAEIRDELVINNLQLADLYLMLPRISSDDEERRRKDLDLFKALLPFAAELKAPGVAGGDRRGRKRFRAYCRGTARDDNGGESRTDSAQY